MWGQEREPGNYCVVHVPNFPYFWEFVISLYSSVMDDVKLVSERLFATVAVSVSCSGEFFYELCRWFVLRSIKTRTIKNLQLKNEQKQAIHAVYSGKDVFVYLPTGFGKSI